jgi:hypothetical protein
VLFIETVSELFWENNDAVIKQVKSSHIRMLAIILKNKDGGKDHDNNDHNVLPKVNKVRRIFFPAFFQTHAFVFLTRSSAQAGPISAGHCPCQKSIK